MSTYVSLEQVLSTVLALYSEDTDLPLPTYEEILICKPTTSAEEVMQKNVKDV